MRFRRNVTVNVSRPTRERAETTEPIIDEIRSERRTDYVLSRTEEVALKVFAGVCVYVLLDTFRQVQVAKASNPRS